MVNLSLQRTDKNAEPEEYDLVILGSGAAGKLAAWNYGKQGKRVAMVERKSIGRSCPNIVCLPSKNIIHSAKVVSYLKRAEEFGIDLQNFKIDMRRVRDRKRKMVAALISAHLERYRANGVDLIIGSGRFIAPRIVDVKLPDGTGRQIRATNVIIDTGTRPAIPAVPGLVQAQPLTHIEALDLDVVPEHVVVFGGGYVGLELSQALRRFGSRVSVIERHARLIHHEDEDVSGAVRDLFEAEGIDVLLNTRVKQVSGRSGEEVTVVVEQNGAEKKVTGSHLLVAVGRLPNVEDIGLSLAGVRLTDRGYVEVNERLQTTAPGVWAVGDVAGSPHLTHISVDDFRVVLANIAGGKKITSNRQVPVCLFIDPELTRVGLNERQAQANCTPYRMFKMPMAEAALRAHTLSETRGFFKALVEKDGDRILGFTAFGVGAGEVMASVQMAMIAGLPYTAVIDAIVAHPTLAEGVGSLFGSAPSVIDIRSKELRS